MDKLDHLGWVVSSSYAIGDVRFAVRSTSNAFHGWLRDALAAHEVEDVEDFLYSVVIPEPPAGGKASEFCILYKGSSAIVRTLDPVTLGRGLLAELEGIGLHERDDAVYLKASVIDVHGTPALVSSFIVPNLAKLGRRASKLGVAIPGQLSVAIGIDEGSVVPIPPGLGIPSDALDLLAGALPWQGRDGLRFVLEPEEPGVFLVPGRDVEGGILRSAPKGYALASLAGWTLNFERVGGAGLRALGRFVERASCYESTWTDATQVIQQLAEMLAEEG
jgi:hypothetical protein